jgi:hypothetical protein
VEVLAEAFVACAQLTGVIMGRIGAVHTTTFPTVNVTLPPPGHANFPPDAVTPFVVPHEKLIPSTRASAKTPFTACGARVEFDEQPATNPIIKIQHIANRLF